jgi:hypothetical protein
VAKAVTSTACARDGSPLARSAPERIDGQQQSV